MLTHRSPRTPLAPVRRRLVPLMVALLASVAAPQAQAQDDAARILVEQGNHWLSRGDFKRAAEAWNKLLTIDPNHVQALHGLGMIEVETGRPDAAQSYLSRLQAHHPNAAQTARLRQAIQVGPRAQVLEQARQQVQRGQTQQAVDSYQTVLGNVPPDGPLALEYYQTLGGTPQGWEEARKGFERLAQASPNDPAVALALAQHLTYREATRRQGIQQLSKLAARSDVGQAASSSWRKALVWSGTRPTDAPLYQAYLQRFPDDVDIRNKLAQIKREQQQREQAAQNAQAAARKKSADPVRQQVTEAFAAFDEGNLQQAENLFQSALQARPNDGDALGGLGIIRLRQERFAEAKNYLEQASKRGAASRWRAALNSASYWSLVEQAEASRAQGNLNASKQLLQQAIKLDANTPTAQIALGDTLAELGELDQAEATYRRVTQRQPDNPDALRGLVGIMAQNNKPDEALALVERLTPTQQEQIGELGKLRAAQAVGLAKAASQRGDDAGARVALEDALLNDPNSPWIRLDLARLYVKMGAYKDARGVMDGLLVSNPDFPDALYASALLSAEMQDWPSALTTLEQIPMANRTREMGALHQRAWVHAQAQRASALAQEGYHQQALQLLAQIEPYGQQNPELLGTIAMAYTQSGNSAKALAMIRQIMARTARPDVGMRLQYASILLSTEQDIELAGVLRQLQNSQMTDSQYQDFEKLRRAYIVRQADALRTNGDLVAAYDTLSPVLATHPDDPDVVGALARMYADADDYPQALTLYRRLLNNNPTDLDLLIPAASMATSAKEYGLAESMLKEALTLAPQDPKALTTAGHLYRAQGKSSKAAEYFAAAVQAEQRQRQQALGLVGGGVPGQAAGPAPVASNNPFASRQGGRVVAAQAQPTALVPIPFTAQPVSQVHTPGTPAQNLIPDPAGARRFAPPAAPAQTYQAPYPQVPAQQPYTAPRNAPAAPSSIPAPYPGGNSLRNTAPTPRNALNTPAARNSLPPAEVALSGAPHTPAGSYYPEYLSTQSPQPTAASTALSELQAIQQERSPSITVGATARSRSGESGLGKLTDFQTPIEASLPLGDGRIAVRATPTMLDAGRVPNSYDVSSRFGGGPAAALDQEFGLVGGAGNQDQTGVGLSLAYAGNWGEVDVGTTPLGFRKTDITGGVKFSAPLTTNMSLSADLSRRPVTDSLLSFAGARDARTGDSWGMVSATGGRVELGWDDQTYGLYGYGSYHSLQGDNVASNSRLEGGAGMYWRLINRPGQELKAGLNLTGMSYDKNLRYFTYGHGGYFSPQTFVSASVPVSWAHNDGRLSYQISGAVGVQHFREDSAPYYPTSSARQSAAEQAVTQANAFGLTGNTTARYGGQSKTGLGYNLNAAMEYQVAPQLFLGGQLALDNARDYNQWLGGVYLRYMFDPQTKPARFPLSPFRSPYQLQ